MLNKIEKFVKNMIKFYTDLYAGNYQYIRRGNYYEYCGSFLNGLFTFQ